MSERGTLWEDLGGEIVEEFERLGSVGAHDWEAGGGLGERRSRLDFYLWASRDDLRAENAALADEYRKHRRGRSSNWGFVLDQQMSRLLPSDWCSRGHDLSVENNALASKSGRRDCKICHRDRARSNYRRKNAMRERLPDDRRERLPDDRSGPTHHFRITTKDDGKIVEVRGYITANTYPDGRLGEILVKFGKSGSQNPLLDQWAIAASFALQCGVSVDEFFRKFVGTRFEPAGHTGSDEIPRCTSVLDYVARWVLLRYGSAEARAQAEALIGGSRKRAEKST